MIVINNPNNPLGVPIPRAVLERIVAFARAHGLLVLSDEVYLPLFHGRDGEAPPSILTLGYDRAVATGSMSKAFALAGLRIGWVASRDRSVVAAVLAARDYTTISVSQLDDGVARFALSDAVRRPLLRRNRQLAQTNASLLAAFVARWHAKGQLCSWHRPTAGTTAFVRFAKAAAKVAKVAKVAKSAKSAKAASETSSSPEPVDDEKFCIDVLRTTKVMLVPGSRCFGGGQDFRGYVRIGYVCETAVLQEGLARLDRYLTDNNFSSETA